MNELRIQSDSSAAATTVQTVLGPVAVEALGRVMTHEHVLWDGTRAGSVHPAADADGRSISSQPVRLDNLWWVRQNYTLSVDNIVLADETLAIGELARFRDVGGGTVVEATPAGLGRDPRGLARVAAASGVNIVMGCGYYVRPSHPPGLSSKDGALVEDEILGDLLEGADGTGIRSGIIGEIGCSWPIDDDERKVLQAAARVQKQTGYALLIHPGRDVTAPVEHMRDAERAGADPSRTIMSHVDRRIADVGALGELARTGCYIEFDCFGLEPWLVPETSGCPMPCDLERIELILWLLSAGFGDRIVVAQDVAMKHRLAAYGGHGYDHVIRSIVPILLARGASDAEVAAILIDNPRRVLSGVATASPA